MPRVLRTITLGKQDNPTTVLCPGHVDAKRFTQAYANEGWQGDGYPQSVLRYEYWTQYKKVYKKSHPGNPKAKRFTVADWD